MATYDLTQSIPAQLVAGDILNCPYSGAPIEIQLPPGRYKLECWGAQGGDYSTTYTGGRGGYSHGVLTLQAAQKLFLRSGGSGGITTEINTQQGGGWNGGGHAYTTSDSYHANAGGGASDVRIGEDSLFARVMVAGAGGGAFGSTTGRGDGGAGGGESGGAGVSSSASYLPGKGATQTEAGVSNYGTAAATSTNGTLAAFGQGGSGGASYSTGGGGGWYGGGFARRAGAGGGSGFVWVGENAPDGYLLTEDHFLSEASTVSGSTSFLSPDGVTETGHAGDGYVRITVIGFPPDPPENFRKTGHTLNGIGLAWDAVEAASEYNLSRNGVQLALVPGTEYFDETVKPYVAYFYELSSVNEYGESKPVVLHAGSVPDGYTLDLITDRTAVDAATGSEKGRYTAYDLNRVGTAMVYIADRLRAAGYVVAVDPKLDWTDEDWVDPEAAAHYLADVTELKRQFELLSTTPALPSDLEGFSYGEANNIEKILEDIDQLLSNILAGQMWYSGDLYSGEV